MTSRTISMTTCSCHMITVNQSASTLPRATHPRLKTARSLQLVGNSTSARTLVSLYHLEHGWAVQRRSYTSWEPCPGARRSCSAVWRSFRWERRSCFEHFYVPMSVDHSKLRSVFHMKCCDARPFIGRSTLLELARVFSLVTPDLPPCVSWVGSGHETTWF